MRRVKGSSSKRVELSECAFFSSQELKLHAQTACKMALLAEGLGARRTAGQFRSAAMMLNTASRFYAAVLREGYVDRGETPRKKSKRK
ncbi:hypothetical protein [Roseibium algae]|uniref:DUF3077 domain-containing protein n=1 Tax=Roseibium algae TaxID=3123038 RepID=A0ABU8TT37_9HYPH